MANPFLGQVPTSVPTGITDPVGDMYQITQTPYHVAGILLVALLLITLLKVSGFRAMIGIGRG